MKVITLLYEKDSFSKENNKDAMPYAAAQLVFCFGDGALITNQTIYNRIQEKFPNAILATCSTAGEIFGVEVYENSISIVALFFEKATLKTASLATNLGYSSYEIGKRLMEMLPPEDLKLAYILADGRSINGSDLVKGLNENRTENLLISGGLAGDGTRFSKTYIGLNELPKTDNVIAIGFYGSSLAISHGSLGGWESFGLEREVTFSQGNVLHEIDNKNALELYKNYLGKYAVELPSSALLFPLAIRDSKENLIVRTILSIDEEAKTMTFAGDIPNGSKVRFMKATFDNLIEKAGEAALNCLQINPKKPKLALLVSCVGRKMILGNRTDEELEAIYEVFGDQTSLSGFYSYGEIAPLKAFTNCELQNQTMTITAIDEL